MALNFEKLVATQGLNARALRVKELFALCFWPEWCGSNAQTPGPKEIRKTFSAHLWPFLIVSARFYFLFGALASTVSTCSAPGCGNQCGQKRFPPKAGDVSPALGRKRFCSSGWLDCNSARRVLQGLSAKTAAQYLCGYKQRKSTIALF